MSSVGSNVSSSVASLPSKPYISFPSATTRARIIQERSLATQHVEPVSLTCNLCAVSYDLTKETHHLQSKAHRTKVAGGEKTKPVRKVQKKKNAEDSLKSWENETECLFCLKSSEDLESNIAHMRKAHSFLIPDSAFLAEPVDLLIYLGAIIEHGDCLYCHSPEARAAGRKGSVTTSDEDDSDGEADSGSDSNFALASRSAFHSAQDARRHMIAKGHCKVSWENGSQIAVEGIYDWGVAEEDLEEDTRTPLERISAGGNQLVLKSGTRLVHRAAVRSSEPTSTALSTRGNGLPSSGVFTRNGRALPGKLTTTLLSMKPSERNAVLRCSRNELECIANYSASQLTAVAKNHDAAFKAKVAEWRQKLRIGEARKHGGAGLSVNGR
ncbi:hypothetical protein HKX48_005122 [Thoreauomyces humboldtii]|nr:hypothetical protein HKX48_005122 [Thoreauomyces humboldtii]